MRTSISINDDVATLAEKIRKKEGRPSFSNMVEVALTEYCTPRSGVDRAAEVLSTAEELGLEESREILARALRRKARAA